MRGKHDALQLYDLLKEHLARPVRHASQSQIAANAQFQKLLRDDANNSSIRRLGREDARAVSREEFLVLLILLYRMFSPVSISSYSSTSSVQRLASRAIGLLAFNARHPTRHLLLNIRVMR